MLNSDIMRGLTASEVERLYSEADFGYNMEYKAPLISGEDGKKALEIALAAQKSAGTGKVIHLPYGE